MPTTSESARASPTCSTARAGTSSACVYIYPVRDSEHDARVLSWVRASRADLHVPLWRSVGDWIAAEWPIRSVEYAERPG